MSTVPLSSNFIAPGGSTRWEPQRTFNYYIQIPGLAADRVIMLACESADFPKVNNAPITVGYFNDEVKVAGRAKVENATVVIRDWCTEVVAKYLADWRRKVYDPESGAIGFASDYKHDIYLFWTDPQAGHDRQFKLTGAWPQVS